MPDSAPAPGSTLAARCTACGTVFRVVPDQLRVSDGWVRCGRCAHVFNAAEALIDLETGTSLQLDLGLGRQLAPAPPQPPPRLPPPPPPRPPQARRGATDDPPFRMLPPGDEWAALATLQVETEADDRALAAPLPERAPDRVSERVSDRLPEPPSDDPSDTAAADEPTPAIQAGSALPSFVRHADRAARWRHPRVRAALAAGCVLAALLLAGQAAHAWRDQAAARWPTLRPALVAGCAALGCQVGPLRSIESLSVESTALLRVEQSALYQLSVSLRNRSTLDLAFPALELSLTDGQGQLLSRRVLRAAELGASQPSLPAGRDLTLQATLQTAPQSTDVENTPVVVGYTIELFYP